MDFRDVAITNLIPQRPPFVMVDGVLCCDDDDTKTVLKVTADNLFLDGEGCLSPAGVIENMAQSCAAREGCLVLMRQSGTCSFDPRKLGEVRIGYIGEIRDCNIERLPRCNETLVTHVHVCQRVFNLTLVQVTVSVGDTIVASALMKSALDDR